MSFLYLAWSGEFRKKCLIGFENMIFHVVRQTFFGFTNRPVLCKALRRILGQILTGIFLANISFLSLEFILGRT
jgi:hypothetical protein